MMLFKRKKHIVLVDDDEALLDSLQLIFEKKGFKVSAIADGKTALSTLQGDKPPDLVILDVMMDGVNGLSILSAIRKNVYAKALPVIVISAFQNEDMIKRSHELGAKFIPKPFKVERLAFEAKRMLSM